MDLSISSSASDHINNFEFAFNSSNFSDRVLKIEIVASANGLKEDEGCGCLSDSATLRKRKREDIKKEKAADYQDTDADDGVAHENSDAEAVATTESPTGEQPLKCSCSLLTVKSMHISSAILAAKSSFFYKLFSNGMRESDQKHATIRIEDTEETALMELLNFIYSGKLSVTEAPQIFDVLMAADKFEVPSCMGHCTKLLSNQQITLESAMLFLTVPCSLATTSDVQPLIDSARRFLVDKHCDFRKEVLNLPLAAIKVILSSDNLPVISEDTVFSIVIEWSRIHYPTIKERRIVLRSLISLVRFPHMTCRKLNDILRYNELDKKFVFKAVSEALHFKAVPRHIQRALASNDVSTNHKYVERTYRFRPVTVMELESPYPQSIVYLDLKKEDCANLYPGGKVRSQTFHLCGKDFSLRARCNMVDESSIYCFGLSLGMLGKATGTLDVEKEISVRVGPHGGFIKRSIAANYKFKGGTSYSCVNLFGMDWDSFMAEGCRYFINGVLHLRADLTVKSLR